MSETSPNSRAREIGAQVDMCQSLAFEVMKKLNDLKFLRAFDDSLKLVWEIAELRLMESEIGDDGMEEFRREAEELEGLRLEALKREGG